MEQEMKKCPYCGHEILAVAKKCRYCGEWLDSELREAHKPVKKQIPCPVCGELVDDGTEVCPHCGEKINIATPAANNVDKAQVSSTVKQVEVVNNVQGGDNKPSKKRVIVTAITFVTMAIVSIVVGISSYVDYMEEFEFFGSISLTFIGGILVLLAITLVVTAIVWFLFPQPKSGDNNTPKKSVKPNYKVIGAIAVVVCILAGIGAVYQHNENKKQEAEQMKNAFISNVNKFKRDASIIFLLSNTIHADYAKNWYNAIWEKKAENADGRTVYCSDFNKALGWRYDYFSSVNAYDCLDSLYEDMSSAYKAINESTVVPDSLKEIKTSYSDIRSKAGEAVELSKNPKGNYQTFNSNANDVDSGLKNLLEQTDIYVESKLSDAYDFLMEKFGDYVSTHQD